MRFNTPEEAKAYATEQALADYERHCTGNWDLNPFCTDCARNDWQRGFDNKPPRSWENEAVNQFDTIYQRGRAMALLLETLKP